MTGRHLGEALRTGRRVYGTLIVSTSPKWVAPVKSLGLDFVLIDTEHIAIGRETLSWMCHAYREHLFIANIESRPAMEALDEILAVDELDAVLVGPHDLSCSLEIPEQYMEAEFEQAIGTIIEKARARGKGAGVHMVYRDGMEQEIRFARRGANLILHRADIMTFRDAMLDELTTIRTALGDVADEEEGRSINI